VKKIIREQVGVEPGYYTIPKSREGLLQYHPKPEELPERSMKDSFTSATLLLGSDPLVRERFVQVMGYVRIGRIMEELDIFAVWICHRHVLLPNLPKGIPLPYTFVTLLVDQAKFLPDKFDTDTDVEMSGYVSYTGHSSMEVTMYVRQCGKLLSTAIFLIVARNAVNSGPAPVNKLVPGNEQEKEIYKEALKRHKKRQKKRDKPESKVPPTKEEVKILFDIFQRTRSSQGDMEESCLPENSRWMSDTRRDCTIHPFPENRNNSNTIFGGFTIRRALETSFIATSLYCGAPAMVSFLSDITFERPIPVHSFMTMSAYVVYTHENYLQTMVMVSAIDAGSHQRIHCNALHVTYIFDKKLDEVMPKTYHEGLWHLRGRRQFQRFIKSAKLEDYDGGSPSSNDGGSPSS
ncbi:hypothetical protein KR067_001694, partial [Drosophila pandora]